MKSAARRYRAGASSSSLKVESPIRRTRLKTLFSFRAATAWCLVCTDLRKSRSAFCCTKMSLLELASRKLSGISPCGTRWPFRSFAQASRFNRPFEFEREIPAESIAAFESRILQTSIALKPSIHAIVRASGTERYSILQFLGALSPTENRRSSQSTVDHQCDAFSEPDLPRRDLRSL